MLSLFAGVVLAAGAAVSAIDATKIEQIEHDEVRHFQTSQAPAIVTVEVLAGDVELFMDENGTSRGVMQQAPSALKWFLAEDAETSFRVGNTDTVTQSTFKVAINELPAEQSFAFLRKGARAGIVDLDRAASRQAAIENLREAIREWPQTQPRLRTASHAFMAYLLHRESRDADALAELERALQTNAALLDARVLLHAAELSGLVRDEVRSANYLCRTLTRLAGSVGCGYETLSQAHFDSPDIAATAIKQLGLRAQERGELETALRWHELAIKTLPPWAVQQLAVVANNIGGVHYLKGDIDAAIGRFNEALEAGLEADNLDLQTLALENIAASHMQLGNYDRAINALLQALDNYEIQEDELGRAYALNEIGGVYLDLRDLVEAERFLTRALRIREAHNPASAARTHLELGQLAEASGRTSDARDYYTKAL